MLSSQVLASKLSGIAHYESGIVDKGRPPTKSSSALRPYDFSKAFRETGWQGTHHFIQTIVDSVKLTGTMAAEPLPRRHSLKADAKSVILAWTIVAKQQVFVIIVLSAHPTAVILLFRSASVVTLTVFDGSIIV
jgi:hypothetical protein